MTNEQLLVQCKIGLDMQVFDDSVDNVLEQKIKMVKSFLKRAGVSEETMSDDLAVGVIVMGVADLWETNSGGVKFSPAFNTLVSQLALGG